MAKAVDYIKHLRTAKSAYFFAKDKPLSKAAINRLFKSTMEGATGNALFRAVAKSTTVAKYRVKYSAIFLREQFEPPFLTGTGLRNVDHGFLLVCELNHVVVIFKSRAQFSTSELTGFASLIPHDKLSRLFMKTDTAYERIGLRMMSVSKDSIHARAFEAPDLTTSMPTLGANRSIPTAFRLRHKSGTHSITPSTGRIGKRDPRGALQELLQWAIEIETELRRKKTQAGFMDYFATPVKLSTLPAAIAPSGALFTLRKVLDGLSDGTFSRLLFKTRGSHTKEVTANALKRISDLSRRVFEVHLQHGEHRLFAGPPPRAHVGYLKVNRETTTVASRSLIRFLAEDAAGGTTNLVKLVNREQDFLVSFSDPRYAYHGGQLFRDDNLLNNISGFMSVFFPVPQLATALTEKGAAFKRADTDFALNSVFGVIRHHIATADDALVCDDIGDEWADLIGISTTAPAVSFYVAKHGNVGLSASGFHVVVGQAQKNLSHLNPTVTELSRKQVKWSEKYTSGDGVRTRIERVLKGADAAAAVKSMTDVSGRPIAQRRMCLVVSLSRRHNLPQASHSYRPDNRLATRSFSCCGF